MSCPVGRVEVSVPATSANLGPGFDSFGLALDVRDRLRLTARRPAGPSASAGCRVSGEGAGAVPLGEDHLVIATLRKALAETVPGLVPPDLELTCDNAIPHGRGLGSSAAAVVAGLAMAWELAALAGAPAAGDRLAWLVDRASALEGHGDNASAAVLGGAVVSWVEGGRYRASPLAVSPDLEVVSAVPDTTLATSLARTLLPDVVPLADAVFTGARTALLVEALRGRRDLLLAATEDRLHQSPRAGAMPRTLDLVHRLRGAGHAAVVSGAGPAVLVLGSPPLVVTGLAGPGWRVTGHRVGEGVTVEARAT
ncbi:MAG: homoserine kinase [Kineosporiaceae bacterium]